MLKEIRDINPDAITDVKELRSAIMILISIVERQSEQIELLREQNRLLQDENNRLKGGNARPVIKPSVKAQVDISSGGKERGNKKVKRKLEDKKPVEIDEACKIEQKPAGLPADSIFKGYSEYLQQDIIFRRRNRMFLFATWYSPSLGKTYQANWPDGETPGHYGPTLRSFVNTMYHMGMTEGVLEMMLNNKGIQISGGTISNMLKAEHGWAVQDQAMILQAGLKSGEPIQTDSTSNVQKGVNKVTHIITSPDFSVFYTLKSKSRLDCLRALQGNPLDISLLWHEGIDEDFKESKVSKADCAKVKALLKPIGVLKSNQFDELMREKAPEILKKGKIMHALREVMAFAYYRRQLVYAPLHLLMSDDAPEYKKLAPYHALCWIHDGRYYNKLSPEFDIHKQKLEAFKTSYWDFYRKLLDFKDLSTEKQQIQKNILNDQFDEIFNPNTNYEALNQTIERTKANKKQLLLVLDFPKLPLHNNTAELAARRVVRKRDISLHTWSDWGTQLRDAFLSIIETAIKLGVSVFDYIHDRIVGKPDLISLAQIINN